MSTNRIKNINNRAALDSTLKATSLVFLLEALNREDYEECPKYIQKAKANGVQRKEIDAVIANYLRKVENLFTKETNTKKGVSRLN